MSFISGRPESSSGSTGSWSTAGGSSASAKRGSVMLGGALCKGVEDSRCSLLACMMPSLSSAAMGVMVRDVTD